MTQADLPMVDVTSVKALDDRRILVRFSDGLEGEYDCSFLLEKGGEMVRPLKEPALFRRVSVDSGAVAWPNGFDLDAIAMYMRLKDAGQLRRSNVAAE